VCLLRLKTCALVCSVPDSGEVANWSGTWYWYLYLYQELHGMHSARGCTGLDFQVNVAVNFTAVQYQVQVSGTALPGAWYCTGSTSAVPESMMGIRNRTQDGIARHLGQQSGVESNKKCFYSYNRFFAGMTDNNCYRKK
jgi:hypothetical protein